ncbi:glycosyl hydrolase family 2, sugar binding domain protein [Bacteroides xylanisolvens SD CC 2a]|jgi:beta-galactosidase/beta-glucuronidase|uniref:Beta-galactosidase/beta-glucuronidase n=2 Tax=Bacteroides xylanisolvens TaxID=371601 RepID=D6D082_9BACE|nr:glycosyl hydrolase family 2, sugar binding domain protein [Bacteroides xylanisolvens SD CC 2a]EFG11125.1 glycosyl hydrolase family 2, sugar binding domain protein [Bacteroides xylanisolvens SD CC 1b]CBK67834.1 Beta-galactosidase/beta-glucuronidase [Bacteroides xylanisolvens XB1A]CDM01051.1 Beta-galactosidase [Bacteroides xylanisolvens SD CC 2a]
MYTMNMKKNFLTMLLALALCGSTFAQWKPAGDKIKTSWGEQLDPKNVLPEYPRPIMERNDWKNLNGLWKYAITKKGDPTPAAYQGDILVPFAVESSLSGVGKMINEKEELWYQRTFDIPSAWRGKQILLHFGAVDWKAEVWVNDVKVGEHTGGFTPFYFDITSVLNKGNNDLVVKVWDPSDRGEQPRGKQIANPHGIWYTPVTGIWQTVWLEPVATQYITNLKTTPDIDNNSVKVEVAANTTSADKVEVKVFDGKNLVAKGAALNGVPVELTMPANAKLWSPDSPFLYNMEVTLYKDGKAIDQVKSYTAMRKYSIRKGQNGITRLQLNNKDYFQFGPLDQGWWPDGLYTAPTDEALVYDLKKTKDFGYNIVRKHVKVEPARWYTHCDQLGLIVWQDMPNGGPSPQWQARNYFNGTEVIRSAASEANYRKEWKEIIDCLYSYPSIAVWVPFNEAWGQFKTPEIVAWTKEYDPSRLVNPASGGNHYTCGDILDLHHYPGPNMFLYDPRRATVLGEYGGIGLVVEGNTWVNDKKNWGYVKFNTSDEVTNEYIKYGKHLLELIRKGFSAAVYTQTTDVEGEINGLMTYDRKVIKMNEAKVREINQQICNSLNK